METRHVSIHQFGFFSSRIPKKHILFQFVILFIPKLICFVVAGFGLDVRLPLRWCWWWWWRR